jgi:2-polyprenyl-6-methoxyphenol hydroxylase-like FAD-dependent oxidoreductase
MRMYADGRPLVSLDLSRIESRFAFMLDIPQNETETLLRERVSELGGAIENNTELLDLTQDEYGVHARIRSSSGDECDVRADFAVGCDGAHSRVRHELGLEFDGHAYPQDWLLADVQLDWSRREDDVHAFFRADGTPMICFPMRDHYWRVVFPYTGDRQRQAPTLAEIQELVAQRAPERVTVSNPIWLANFRCQRRSTTAYRRGRVMLAGDAVHVHSPAGGQGMNTGITDAHNLAWKLALVVTGRASETLLDSYGEERAPVAAQVLEWTHSLVSFGTLTHPVKRVVRDTVVPLASRVPAIQRWAVRRMSQQHVEYRASSLTQRSAQIGQLRAGDRAPDLSVRSSLGTSRLVEVLRAGRHILVTSSTADSVDLGHFVDQVDVVVCDELGRAVELPWLVRPDGYLAAIGTAGAMAYLDRVFAAEQADIAAANGRLAPSATSQPSILQTA